VPSAPTMSERRFSGDVLALPSAQRLIAPLTMVPVRRALRLVIDRKARSSRRRDRSSRASAGHSAAGVIRSSFVHVPRRSGVQVTNTFLFARTTTGASSAGGASRAAPPECLPGTTWYAVAGGHERLENVLTGVLEL